MFQWNIAKSLEELFSRWAVKRLCKFLLKKKLGQFILGEIDIDQLDVQLRAGTIQLSGLALNVDYINQKVAGEVGLTVKEGSIGSLLVQMPWKGNGFQVEVDELELVLSHCVKDNFLPKGESSMPSQYDIQCTDTGLVNLEHNMVENESTHASIDVHEGVKTIAKMVKWLLTSFHVNVKKMIVAFDPCLKNLNKEIERDPLLVLRISEIECGASVPEDETNSNINFLGISQLKNFVKFHGASLELLQIEDENNQCNASGDLKTIFGTRTPILIGENGGFSGNLTLSIPWKNGSLDMRKVDTEISIDPIKLKLQPNTIKWILILWESLKNLDKDQKDPLPHKAENSVYYNSESQFHSSLFGSDITAFECVAPVGTNLYPGSCSEIGQDSLTDGLLPGSRFISDWVSSCISYNQADGRNEIDFTASVDQFFECFDDIRGSQSYLASSGLLNWTCSVFGALTAASNLASGSLHVSSEQQHVETNLKATIAGISILLSFNDNDEKPIFEPNDYQEDARPNTHYLVSEFRGILLSVQVCSQNVKLEVNVEHIELVDCISNVNNDENCGFCVGSNDICSQSHLVQHLQSEVEGVLPPFALSTVDFELKNLTEFFNRKDDNLERIKLLRTTGVCHCQIKVNCTEKDSFSGLTSMSLELPPFIFWVNFHLVNMLYDLLKQFEPKNSFSSEAPNKNVTSGSNSEQCGMASPSKDLCFNIFVPNARVILCFPFDKGMEFGSYSSWNKFISLDFSSPSTVKRKKVQNTDPASHGRKKHSSSSVCSLSMNVGNLDIHLITSDFNNKFGNKLHAQNILSAISKSGHLSEISMVWKEGSVTGSSITEKSKFLASSGNSKNRERFIRKDCELASVITIKDLKDFNSLSQQEIILSSATFMRIHLSPVTVHLNTFQYEEVYYLINQVISSLRCDPISVREESSVSQTSTILVECDSVEFSISLNIAESNKKISKQNELLGSWYKFKLKIMKFELLSVSNMGRIKGYDFIRVAHGEGKLCGSITEVQDREFILISCSNSAMKRGNGQGSNALSSCFAGFEILHLKDPQTLHNHTSITVRCCTVVAIDGRMDWLDEMSSFFTLPSEREEFGHNDLQKSLNCRESFVLNLVDIGLNYEPYLKNYDKTGDQYVACLLAASSLSLSNTKMNNLIENEYRIKVQDLGLLVRAIAETEIFDGIYSAEHMHNIGYVKVAGEALVEAKLRTNCENGLLWELDCSECHINLDTCSDTFSGLIRLATQLQELFAPNLEETFVHLQARWNNFKQAQDMNQIFKEKGIINIETDSSSLMGTLNLDPNSKLGHRGLMDEICEDAFYYESHGSHSFETLNLNIQTSCPLKDSFPECIEDYCNQLSKTTIRRKSKTERDENLRRGNCRWYGDTSLRIVENHIPDKNTGNDTTNRDLSLNHCARSDDDVTGAKGRVLLKNINVRWRMYAGSDWQNPRINSQCNKRDATVCLELALTGMDATYVAFPDGEVIVSKLSLSVRDLNFYDNSRDAPWKMVLGYYHSKDNPRDFSSKAVKVDLEVVRPDPLTPLEEYRVRIALLPLLLHLHQSQLDFLVCYFGDESSSVIQPPNCSSDSSGSNTLPVRNNNFGGHIIADEALLPYIQKFEFFPLILRVDYTPRRVDLAALSGGKYVELLNLVPWKGIELQLKDVLAMGIYGWSSVCETILGEWLEDISQNQVHKLFQGLPTIRSMVSLSSGAAKLVSLPLENYRKDNKLVKGMQRGTVAFLRSVSLEAVALGVHLAAGAHDILVQAECILGNIPPSVPPPSGHRRTNTNIRSNQPKDAQQGFQQAYESISDGLGKSATALIRAPLKKYQRGAGAGSALVTAVRATPAAAIAPASATARALHCAFLGVRNSLDPEHKRESIQKYQGPSLPRDNI